MPPHEPDDLFENDPQTELRVLELLLRRDDPRLLEDITLHPARDSVPIDDCLASGEDHRLWFAHARLPQGGVVKASVEIERPTLLFSFTLDAPELEEICCRPGSILLYEGFEAQQVRMQLGIILGLPVEALLRQIARLLNVRHSSGLGMLAGKVIVLGPFDVQDAMRG